MVFEAIDGRGNTAAIQTDLLGRTARVSDATGETTTTSYDPVGGQPVVITDTMDNTSYDE